MSVQVREIKRSLPVLPEQTPEDKLLEFVDEQINKMQKYSNLGDPQGMPGFFELNQAMMNYTNINCSLIAMDVIAKQELQYAQDRFDEFMADKYMIERSKYNPTSLSSTKWASQKELEYAIICDYKDEYNKLKSEVKASEKKVAFLRRMLDAWEKQSLILNRLSKNVEVEALKLNADV